MQEAIKKIFEVVRDIPYQIPIKQDEPVNTCHEKARLLYNLLRAYGFEARISVCAFKWSKQPLPPALKEKIENDEGFHSFVEIKINNKWVKLDPSFDRGLKGKLPVNEWDGQNDTQLAVIPDKFLSAEESMVKNQKCSHVDSENIELYKALNELYKNIRSKRMQT